MRRVTGGFLVVCPDLGAEPAARRGDLSARCRKAALAFGLTGTVTLIMLTGLLFGASVASAANLFTLDAHADGLGHVVMDATGNVYVGWNHASSGAADTPMFCKFALGSTCTSPVSLTLPGPNGPNQNGTAGDFPIQGPGSTVYVVGPRYVDSDTVVWTSTDGGATFGGGTVIANSYNQTNAESVLLQGSNLLIGGVNVGLSFDSTPLTPPPAHTLLFSNPGAGGVASGSLAVDQNGNPVEAYWNLSSPQALNYYYYNGSGSMDSESNWTGPVSLGVGQTPSLAGGPAGLYLLSADGSNPSNPAEPTALDVRSYSATSHTFGSPVTLLTNPASGFDEGGGLATTPGGKVVAIWPDVTADGAAVLDSFASTNGGASFAGPAHVATRAGGYGGQASVAAIDQGAGVAGVMAFNDANGLELANLTPTVQVQPTQLTTSQTAGAQLGGSITVPAGTIGETDHATISGVNASAATGTMAYRLFSSSSCTASSEVFASATAVSGGVTAASAGVGTALAPGTYYWEAGYSGDALNSASASACGSEILTITPAASAGGNGTSNGSSVTITVSCAVTPCTVTITITIDPPAQTARAVETKKKQAKIITIAKGSFRIRKHGERKLGVKLTKAGKKLLKKDHGHLKAKLLVFTKVDGHGENVSRTIHITTIKHHKK
jgi:hypothetical protein